MNMLATVIDKDQLDAARPQQFRYLHKEAAIDWNTVGRYALEAIPGAGLGVLFNRGVLGNKSLLSNATAGLLGGTASTGLVEALRSIDATNEEARKKNITKPMLSTYKARNAAKEYVEQKDREHQAQTGQRLSEPERLELLEKADAGIQQIAPIGATTAGIGIDGARLLHRYMQRKKGGPGALFLNRPEDMYTLQFPSSGPGTDTWKNRMDSYQASGLKAGSSKPTVSEYVDGLQLKLEKARNNLVNAKADAAKAVTQANIPLTAKQPASVRQALDKRVANTARLAESAQDVVSDLNKKMERWVGNTGAMTERAVANQYVEHSPIIPIDNVLRQAADPIPSPQRTKARWMRAGWVVPSVLAGMGIDITRALINRSKAEPQLKAIYDKSDNTPIPVYKD